MLIYWELAKKFKPHFTFSVVKGGNGMKSFEEKLKELQAKVKNKEIKSIEWAQENEEVDGGKTIITTKFKYEAPTPIKRKD